MTTTGERIHTARERKRPSQIAEPALVSASRVIAASARSHLAGRGGDAAEQARRTKGAKILSLLYCISRHETGRLFISLSVALSVGFVFVRGARANEADNKRALVCGQLISCVLVLWLCLNSPVLGFSSRLLHWIREVHLSSYTHLSTSELPANALASLLCA